MTAHNLFTIGWPMFWMALFFLPTLAAILTHHPRYIIVGIYNVLIGFAALAYGWLVLGWLLLLWLVLRRQYPALMIGRRTA